MPRASNRVMTRPAGGAPSGDGPFLNSSLVVVEWWLSTFDTLLLPGCCVVLTEGRVFTAPGLSFCRSRLRRVAAFVLDARQQVLHVVLHRRDHRARRHRRN